MTKAIEDGKNRSQQRARVRPEFARGHPSIDRDRWYQVLDPEQIGFFLELGGALRFVFWEHFEVVDPAP